MQLSCIGSKNTYHKCIKGLHQFGYIIFHTATSKYLPAKITMIRLDIKNNIADPLQLDLFNGVQFSDDRKHIHLAGEEGLGARPHVPDLTGAGINNETQQVPGMGHYIKPNNLKNCVNNTPTNRSAKRYYPSPKGEGAPHNAADDVRGISPQVPKLRHTPTIEEVELYFKQQFHNVQEAHKFFYYNQSKNWMLTDKIPVYNWQALANKWMLNEQPVTGNQLQANLDRDIQYIYDRYLEGEKINKLLVPEYADHLQLQLADSIMQQAWQRRINQLSGSNETSEQKLWQAYMTGDTNHELLINDQPNLIALAKRLAVSRYFQKLKSQKVHTLPITHNS